MSDLKRKRILSGVQPSGKLHIGNYFGAIKQQIELQDRGEAYYFIADYHAMTSVKEAEAKEAAAAQVAGKTDWKKSPEILAENTHDVALDYLALGLDPNRSVIYRQSDLPVLGVFGWLFSTVTGMGLLERAHSYKDKVAKGITPNVGLFTYPILMAADILIVRADEVPVGRDQVQHLEMTRDMAGYFNQAYGEIFPEPRELLGAAPIVPGTDGQKMSKSYNNTIEIFAEGKALKTAVMSIVTDSTPLESPKNPDTCNVFALYKLFATSEELENLARSYREPMLDAESRKGRAFGYGDAKNILLKKIEEFFAPARERRKQLLQNPDGVEQVLRDGARKAQAEARKTMSLVRRAVGMPEQPVK